MDDCCRRFFLGVLRNATGAIHEISRNHWTNLVLISCGFVDRVLVFLFSKGQFFGAASPGFSLFGNDRGYS